MRERRNFNSLEAASPISNLNKGMFPHFCLRQHFHDNWKKNEDNGPIEVESAKEKNCLFKKRENLEGEDNQDTGERTCCSLDKILFCNLI